jgi:hypothetical protein
LIKSGLTKTRSGSQNHTTITQPPTYLYQQEKKCMLLLAVRLLPLPQELLPPVLGMALLLMWAVASQCSTDMEVMGVQFLAQKKGIPSSLVSY